MYRKILVGVDGSKQAEKAFERALELSLKFESKLAIAHVVDLRAFSPDISYDGSFEDRAYESGKKRVEECAERAKSKGITDVVTYVEKGNPKNVLAETLPKSQNIDLIIVAATGLNTMERFLLGSVPQHVVTHAETDTLIVK